MCYGMEVQCSILWRYEGMVWYGIEEQCVMIRGNNVVWYGGTMWYGMEEQCGMVWRNPLSGQTGQQDQVLAGSFREYSWSFRDPV